MSSNSFSFSFTVASCLLLGACCLWAFGGWTCGFIEADARLLLKNGFLAGPVSKKTTGAACERHRIVVVVFK